MAAEGSPEGFQSKLLENCLPVEKSLRQHSAGAKACAYEEKG